MENIAFSYAGSDQQFRKTAGHSHRGWELLYLVSGRCKIHFSSGEKFDGLPGDTFLIPPHLGHERFNLESCRTIYAVFECDARPGSQPGKTSAGNDRLLREWFEALPELNKIYDPLQTSALIRAILLRLDWIETREQQNRDIHPALKTACDYMATALDQPIQIGDIARKAAVSQSHLNLLFRTRLGVSPLRYLMTLRMNRARRLLLNPYCNITETARQCGFSDLHYFTRCFTAYHHVSPSVYRRNPAQFADTENRTQTNGTGTMKLFSETILKNPDSGLL